MSRKNKAKIERYFYTKLLRIFLITNLIGICILGIIGYRLTKYEESTPEGAIRNYLNLVKEKKFDEIYEESKLVFAQFNTKEVYSTYLDDLYSQADLTNIKLSRQSYSNEEFLYYIISNEKKEISTVQLKKDKNKYHVRTLTSIWNFDFDVVSSIRFSINDVEIDEGYIQEREVVSKAFENMDDSSDRVLATRYHLDNFVNIPHVETLDPNTIAVKDAIKDLFYVGNIPSTQEKLEYENLISNLAQTYSKYITEDESFYNLRKLVDTKTEYYRALSSFSNRWFSNHDSVEFKDIEIYDLVKLDDTSFIGSIKYNYIVYAKDKVQEYPSSYQITFVKKNDKWLCTNLSLIN